ncbi:hypothetical protein [Rathayibacter sp. VKM Ac-2630]|uniref:hypothetical protein n=1 Tax=Rathayibacter sp. VKM Ac-2630 TaxID=1938617 RepID=UPI0009819C4B|nr:hypothetical protein [Rathayibacter sp. VKM Ac-2630]OOB90093.1 hypothetical protein B0T42_13730 [Rathayibacter sp. VKM Ac-2630]
MQRVRRPEPREEGVLVLGSTEEELALLLRELASIAQSPCLDARTAAIERRRALQEEAAGWSALPARDVRRVRVRLRLERENLRRGRIGCRHVLDPPGR